MDEAQLHELCVMYFRITQNLQSNKQPPTTQRYLDKFKAEGHTLSVEDFNEIKDYAENDFGEVVKANIEAEQHKYKFM